MHQEELKQFLLGYITPHKASLFNQMLEKRTRYLTVVMEDIYQSHNISAVMRSCEAFGLQEAHVIENRNRYDVIADIALGSTRWMNIYRYHHYPNNTLACIQSLKNRGYRLVGTLPAAEGSTPLQEYKLTGKTALVLGTEKTGMSKQAIEHCDDFIHIPMYGFTESLNLSVSGAICIQHLGTELRKSNLPWQFTADEKLEQFIQWSFLVTRHKKHLLEYFNKLKEENEKKTPLA